jgi:hypothetical protein
MLFSIYIYIYINKNNVFFCIVFFLIIIKFAIEILRIHNGCLAISYAAIKKKKDLKIEYLS